MDGIASAVMLPEQETDYHQQEASPPAGQKRRQASVSEQETKRQRLNSIDANVHPDRRSSLDGKGPSTTAPTRRERGRERRLFGAALGALSQNSATAAQRKRSEIEKRQKAQRELEEQESDQRKLEREVRRKAQRQREQKRFESDSMRSRHANLLNMAHFLQTEAEPRLYYKPWETTPDEDNRIRDQIAEAEELVWQELEAYEALQKEDSERERHDSRNTDAERNAGANPPIGKEFTAHAPQQQPTTNEATNDSGTSPKDLEMSEDHAEGFTSEAVSGEQAVVPSQHNSPTSREAAVDDEADKDVLDENGEEVVEAAEDTVIY